MGGRSTEWAHSRCGRNLVCASALALLSHFSIGLAEKPFILGGRVESHRELQQRRQEGALTPPGGEERQSHVIQSLCFW